MKRLFSFLLIVSILFSFSICAFADATDWSNLSDDEISSIISSGYNELMRRQMEQRGNILMDNELATVEFIEFTPSVGISGFYMTLRIINNTDRKISFQLEDFSLNNEMVNTMMSGGIEVLPGKIGSGAYILPNQYLSFSSIDGIEQVSFRLKLFDPQEIEIIAITDEITFVYDN